MENEKVSVKMTRNVNICDHFLSMFDNIKMFRIDNIYQLDTDIAEEWVSLGRCIYVS